MPKSTLPDVDVEIQDGGLGLTSETPSGTHVKIGGCTGAQVGSYHFITKPDDVAEKLGSGPLAKACLDSMQMGSKTIIAVVAAASMAGTVGNITHSGTGSATYVTSGTPNNEYDVVIEVLSDGTLNEAQYRLSIDGGDNWLPKKTVPLDGAIEVSGTGVTVTFTAGVPAAGSFVTGDKYSLKTTAPAMSNADFLAALSVVKNNNFSYEFIHVVGESAASLWAVCATEADALEASHVPTFFVLEARNIDTAETVDTYVQALVTEAGSFAKHPRISIVAARSENADLNGLLVESNGAGLYTGILGKSKEHESPGKVMSYRLTPAMNIKPDGLTLEHIAMLDAAGYVTFRRYVDMSGIYVTNGRMMAPLGSDYEYVETRRIADKASRRVRLAALVYLQSEADADGLANLKSHMEAPLDEMMSPDNKQLGGYLLTIDPEQDIITTETLSVGLGLYPIPIMRWIYIKQRMMNPFAR